MAQNINISQLHIAPRSWGRGGGLGLDNTGASHLIGGFNNRILSVESNLVSNYLDIFQGTEWFGVILTPTYGLFL